MQVRIAHDAPREVRASALVVPVFSDGVLDAAAAEADKALDGSLSDASASGETTGKLYETTLLHAKDLPFRRLLAIGLGSREGLQPYVVARYAGTAVRELGRRGITDLAVALPDAAVSDAPDLCAAAVEGAVCGAFEITLYQERPESRVRVDAVTILRGKLDAAAAEAGVRRGMAVGESVNLARRLAVTPSNDMTPTILAGEAVKAATEAGLRSEVHDAQWARSLGMGSFLSVSAGSAQPPVFIEMHYQGNATSNELLALVGKGITFDTGGISLKPAEKMEDMKYDMSGGAAVIAAMRAIGLLKPSVNVVGLVPATENMPGGRATKPGDIVRAMNGKSIEVINTDAEGRLILADALCYANQLGATRVCDAATLTGAVTIALGKAFAAIFSNDETLYQTFSAAAQGTGERYWRLPLDDDYTKAMKSDIADLKNTGGRPGGTCTAAAFLHEFVGTTPWLHLDVAATAYGDKASSWSAKGPTGIPVRSFIALAESLSA